MGLNTLWLMPIPPIGGRGRKGKRGSPYSVRDYFAINPEYGDEQDFAALIQHAHRFDMLLILDLVFHYSGNDHIFVHEKSHWWTRDLNGRPTPTVPGWQDVADFSFHQREVWDYLLEVMKYWVTQFDVDGYRCDMVRRVPDPFWSHVIPRVTKIKPNLFFGTEWEAPGLHVESFHASSNWALYFISVDMIQ